MLNLEREKRLHAISFDRQIEYLRRLHKKASMGEELSPRDVISVFYKVAISRIDNDKELLYFNSAFFPDDEVQPPKEYLEKCAKLYKDTCSEILKDEPLIKIGAVDVLDYDYEIAKQRYSEDFIFENKIRFHDLIRKLSDQGLVKEAEEATYIDALKLLFSKYVTWTWKLAFLAGIPLMIYGLWDALRNKKITGLLLAGLGGLVSFSILRYMKKYAPAYGFASGGKEAPRTTSRTSGTFRSSPAMKEMRSLPFTYETIPPSIPTFEQPYRSGSFYSPVPKPSRAERTISPFLMSALEQEGRTDAFGLDRLLAEIPNIENSLRAIDQLGNLENLNLQLRNAPLPTDLLRDQRYV